MGHHKKLRCSMKSEEYCLKQWWEVMPPLMKVGGGGGGGLTTCPLFLSRWQHPRGSGDMLPGSHNCIRVISDY